MSLVMPGDSPGGALQRQRTTQPDACRAEGDGNKVMEQALSVTAGRHRPVLVLAPHPDDESLGCGGTLRLLTNAEIAVHVLYLTRGELGSEAVGAATVPEQTALARVRASEAAEACRLLGVARVDFLDGRDSQLADQPQLAATLQQRLVAEDYQRVFCPWPQEHHPDHAATFLFYRQAVGQLRRVPDTWLYEVWTPLSPNMLVPIDATLADKLAAIQAHRSQLACLDYVAAFQGLAAYRSLACPPSRYAEAFRICDRETLWSDFSGSTG